MQYGIWSNGIGLSKKIKNAFDDLINVDVHTEIGSLMCQKTLIKKSGSLTTSGYYRAVVPTGDVYFFSKTSSEILKRSIADGTYSKVRDGSNGPFKGAAYYRNYLYYTMDGYLGRYDFGSVAGSPSTSVSSSLSTSPSSSLSISVSSSPSVSSSISHSPSASPSVSPSSGTPSWNDSYQVLTTGVEHPLFQFDLILYIGNGYNVASLDDSGTFSSSVLDQNVEDEIFALINLGDDLLTLSNPGSYINESSITRWNTYSDSWSYKDTIKQKGAYAFLDSDNYVHVVCVSGDIYLYNGAKLETFSNIRDAATTTGHQLTTNFQGKPLIANGGRIFSLHRKNRNMPFALVGEYTCSAGVDATIHSIVACGDQLIVSWEYNGTYGIDEISSSYYANARIITPRFRKANKVEVFYDDLNGASIGIYSRLDGETNWTSHEVIDDSDDRRCVRTVDDMLIKSGGQALITITPSGTSSPVLDYINVE
jgi:hypothetical protein